MSIKQTTSEQQRLDGQNAGRESWHEWGPYLSERQWGTVREDYSALGDSNNNYGIFNKINTMEMNIFSFFNFLPQSLPI
jgi:hypothetical protein